MSPMYDFIIWRLVACIMTLWIIIFPQEKEFKKNSQLVLVLLYSIKMFDLNLFLNVQDFVTFSFLSKRRSIMKGTKNMHNFVFLFLEVIRNVNNTQ